GDLAVAARRGRPPPPLEALEVARNQLECDAAVVWLDPLVLDPFEDAVLELDRPGRALVSVAEVLAVDGDHGRRARRVALEARQQLGELSRRAVSHQTAYHDAPHLYTALAA